MNEILLWLFAFICIGLLSWGLSRKDGIYQYPFLMGATFVGFILPQAISLIKNHRQIPDIAVTRLLVMACLCAAMCLLGYIIPEYKLNISKPTLQFNSNRLRIISIIFIVVGILFWVMINTLTENGKLGSSAPRIVAIYSAFAELLSVGYVAILIESLRKPKFINFLILVSALAMPIYRTIFLGRREQTVFIILAVVIGFYFVRRITIPKVTAVIGIILATLMIFNIGEYRNAINTEKWDTIITINPVKTIEKLVSGDDVSPAPELRNAAILIDSTIRTRKYGWGSSYWDRLIFRWIPAQLIGSSFKDNLQFSLTNYEIDRIYAAKTYGFSTSEGSTSTGIGESFTQFDYFGCLVFALIGAFFKFLWNRAVYLNCIISQGAYLLLAVKAMLALTHLTSAFPADVFQYALFSIPLVLYARKKPKESYLQV